MKLAFNSLQALLFLVIFPISRVQVHGLPTPHLEWQLEEELIHQNKLPQIHRIFIPKRDGVRQEKQWIQIYFPDNLPQRNRRRKFRKMRVVVKPGESCDSQQQKGMTYLNCLLEHVLKIEEPNPLPTVQFPVDESPIIFEDSEPSPPSTSGVPVPWLQGWLKRYFHKIQVRSGTSYADFLEHHHESEDLSFEEDTLQK